MKEYRITTASETNINPRQSMQPFIRQLASMATGSPSMQPKRRPLTLETLVDRERAKELFAREKEREREKEKECLPNAQGTESGTKEEGATPSLNDSESNSSDFLRPRPIAHSEAVSILPERSKTPEPLPTAVAVEEEMDTSPKPTKSVFDEILQKSPILKHVFLQGITSHVTTRRTRNLYNKKQRE